MPSRRADEEFVEQHWRLALWVARRRARQAGWRGDPDEVESDAVLGLWIAARTFPGGNPAAWARTHVDRTITDGLRDRYGDVRYAGKATLSAATQSDGLTVAQDAADPNDWAVHAVNRVDVARALVRLTPRQRYVVVARYRDGLTWQAIGGHLGITESGAHRLATEARARLTRALTVPDDHGPHHRYVRWWGPSCVSGLLRPIILCPRSVNPGRRRHLHRVDGQAADPQAHPGRTEPQQSPLGCSPRCRAPSSAQSSSTRTPQSQWQPLG